MSNHRKGIRRTRVGKNRNDEWNWPWGLGLGWPYIDGPWTFFPSFHFELDVLAFFEPVKIQVLQSTAVEENLLTLGGLDKSESTITNNSLDSSLHRFPRLTRIYAPSLRIGHQLSAVVEQTPFTLVELYQ